MTVAFGCTNRGMSPFVYQLSKQEGAATDLMPGAYLD